MAIKDIKQKDISDVLYKTATSITDEEFGSPKLSFLIKDMFDTLNSTADGVALACPQIGISKRIFVISKKLAEESEQNVEELVYINPVIVKSSTKKIEMDEGCLSVKDWYGKIDRHEKVTVSAYDQSGKKFTRGASGLLSEIFQHEIDHLEGILFTDTARDLRIVEKKKDEEES